MTAWCVYSMSFKGKNFYVLAAFVARLHHATEETFNQTAVF